MLRAIFRWLFRRCMDCGRKLQKGYDRGDICTECFHKFNGLTIDDLLS